MALAASASESGSGSGRMLYQLHISSNFSSRLRNSTLGFLPKDESRIKVKNSNYKDVIIRRYPTMKMTASMALESGSVIPSEKLVKKPGIEGVLDLPLLTATDVAATALRILRVNVRRRNNLAAQIQMAIEKGILNCRFFTLAGVVGTLLGSILCFVEFKGCVIIVQSFCAYFRNISHHTDPDGQTMHLLIEALDMYLLGTGMLNFGFGMYIMFIGSRGMNVCKNLPSITVGSNPASRLHQRVPISLSQAKTNLGHAIMMILQAGTVEKFKNVPLATGFDLACFAGAILISSTSVFLLSRLLKSPPNNKDKLNRENHPQNHHASQMLKHSQ